MKTITEAEFTATFDDVMCEVFELFTAQRLYLEVLTNEKDYVGCVREFKVGELHNLSYVFAYDTMTKKYAFQKHIDDGVATETFYRYDDLAEAKAHAATLLNVELANYNA
jgi:hypothetical protein